MKHTLLILAALLLAPLNAVHGADATSSPTRASLLTGQHPARIGITAPACYLPLEVVPLSSRWREAFQWAVHECERLGIEFDVSLDSGYGSGGPHITPELSMQRLVWSDKEIDGGRPINVVLEKPRVEKKLSAWLRPGAKIKETVLQKIEQSDSFRDVAVVATPLPASQEARAYRIAEMAVKAGLHWNRPAQDGTNSQPPPGAVTLRLAPTPTTQQSGSGLKIEHFDRDPGWEGFNNRLMPKVLPTVTQDFGYSATNFAGKERGEMGGRVQRSATPAYYADRITRKTLSDKLTATGTFALRASAGTTGVFFGWFNSQQTGGSGRPINSLGLDLDGEPSGARLAVRMIGSTNKSCGTFITPFTAGKRRPTPIKNDGTRYTWTLNYDPEANDGNGRFQFAINSNSVKPEEFEGKTFSVDLPPGFKKEGATFDRFGLMNMLKSGNALTIYFDDLAYDGKTEDFATDPSWEASGNRGTFQNLMPAGAHDFGYSATNFAGGSAGEVGGVFWRSGKYAYYADRVGPLTLDDRLEASGRVVLVVGGVDADMYLGWFNGANKDKPPTEAGHFLGVHVGGPTRVGHYFQPAFRTAAGKKGHANGGPLLVPGKVYDWSLVYDPDAEGGQGAIQVTLGKESVTLPLKRGNKQGVSLDRFGLFTPAVGGQIVKIYLDDLKYTAARHAR